MLGEGYWIYNFGDTCDAYIPKNNLSPGDHFERCLPKYVPENEAGRKSVGKGLSAF